MADDAARAVGSNNAAGSKQAQSFLFILMDDLVRSWSVALPVRFQQRHRRLAQLLPHPLGHAPFLGASATYHRPPQPQAKTLGSTSAAGAVIDSQCHRTRPSLSSLVSTFGWQDASCFRRSSS